MSFREQRVGETSSRKVHYRFAHRASSFFDRCLCSPAEIYLVWPYFLSVAFSCRNKSHVFFCRSVKVNVSDSCRSTGFSMKFPKEGNTRLTIYATAYAVYSMCTPFQRARPCPAGEPGQKQRSMLQKEIMSQAYLCGYEHEHESRYSSRYKYVFVQVATVYRQIGVREK